MDKCSGEEDVTGGSGARPDGIEWNLRHVDPVDPAPLLAARAAFEALLARPEVTELTPAWIDAYEARRIAPLPAITGTSVEAPQPADKDGPERRPR